MEMQASTATTSRHPRAGASRATLGALVLVVLGVVAGIALFPVMVLNGEEVALGEATLISTAFASFTFVGGLVAARAPGNAIGWLMLVVGVGALVMNLLQQVAVYGLGTREGSIPGALALAWLSNWGFYACLAAVLFLLLLFPSGRPATAGWTTVLRLDLAIVGLALASLAFGPRRLEVGNVPNPLRIDGLSGVFGWIHDAAGWLLLFVVASCAAAPFFRARRAAGDERSQLKWLAYGAVIFAICFGVIAPLSDVVLGVDIGTVSWAVGLGALPIAIGVGILGYRLFEFEMVANRTLVYFTLTATLVAIYVGLISILDKVVGEAGGALIATAAVAVAFQPLRYRLQRGIDRITFGKRDEPYEVLSELAARLEASLASQEALDGVTETVASALRLPYVAIELTTGDGARIAAESGRARETVLELPLVHRGEEVGRLKVAARAEGENFSAADLRLLEDLARQAGAAAYATRLLDELQRSRERLVTALEDERRRIRRDLHDGLGPSLAAMALELQAARNLVEERPAEADALLNNLVEKAQAAIADIRRLVYGLRPPALDELGLIGALSEQAVRFEREGGLRVTIATEGHVAALSAAHEVAIYRIIMEAITNAMKHARGSRCDVTIRYGPDIVVEVRDDGVGMAPAATAGVGLSSIRERAEELGGTVLISGAPGGGTLVRSVFPGAAE
jgi:two-component system, NarL family, sensor kinase